MILKRLLKIEKLLLILRVPNFLHGGSGGYFYPWDLTLLAQEGPSCFAYTDQARASIDSLVPVAAAAWNR